MNFFETIELIRSSPIFWWWLIGSLFCLIVAVVGAWQIFVNLHALLRFALGRPGVAADEKPGLPIEVSDITVPPAEDIDQVETGLEPIHGEPVVIRPDYLVPPPLLQKPHDTPPTPPGCEWLKSDNGWNLWRYWSERDRITGERVRKTRYAGFLSDEAWELFKWYPHEVFISIIGQRLRRYGQR